MSDSKKKILEMLDKKKITAEEAYRLLSVLDSKEGGHEDTGRETNDKTKHKYLRVTIGPGENQSNSEHIDRVNVRVPMSLIRAGIKLTSLIPPEALDKANQALNDKGIKFDVRNMKPDDVESLIDALGDTQIDIEGGKGEKVKVFVE
ncbi:MAG: hypothetical protein ABR954_06860 [Dehalococcoidales bacterium]|jgi:hypothetical protein